MLQNASYYNRLVELLFVKMKVAILLPGLLRNYDKTVIDMRNFLISPNNLHEINIFMCCWDQTFPKNSWDAPEMADFEDALDLYKPLGYKVLSMSSYSSLVKELTDSLLALNELPSQGVNFVMNAICYQFLCWKEALLMLEEPESYDLIIKSRFDLIYSKVINLEMLIQANKLICSGSQKKFMQHGFCDIFFAGTYDQISPFMLTANTLKNYSSKDNLFPEIILRNMYSKKIGWNYSELAIELRR